MTSQNLMKKISAEELVGEEWADWYSMTPMERWRESAKLWEVFLSLGGSLDPEPDTQSPFFDREAPSSRPVDGRRELQLVRRDGVRTFELKSDPMANKTKPTNLRIISLIASASEIVCALGFEDQLVGRSHECDYPPSVKLLPQLTSPKFKVEGSSIEIDQRVKASLLEALGVYHVDPSLLEELKPTHIITQSQCDVCAVSLKDVEQAVCELTSSNPVIVSLEPNSLDDVWADIRRVGEALGAAARAEQLVDGLQSRMDDIVQRTHWLDTNPGVAYIEWIDPLMAGGNWMPELVEMAGGVNLFGESGKHSPWMTWDELVTRDPEIIFVSPCGFDIARTLQEMHLLSGKPEWKSLKAVAAERVFVADGNQYFNRPGPRLAESLEILAEIIHPNVFHFGHEGHGWVLYP